MLPDRVSNPGPLTYESGALPIALRGPACISINWKCRTVYEGNTPRIWSRALDKREYLMIIKINFVTSAQKHML